MPRAHALAPRVPTLPALALAVLALTLACTLTPTRAAPTSTSTTTTTTTHRSNHTSNWAVIVDTSAFWYNYRHASNALAIYRAVKQGGIPDSQIVLFIAEDAACNARNVEKGTVYDGRRRQLYGADVQIDYRGREVTEENVLRVLMGRHDPDTPANKRMLSDERSNVLVYMTGHGGDSFLKFRDTNVVGAPDLADALAQMKAKRRFNELLFMADTCQAGSLFEDFATPGVVAVASAAKGENSYGYDPDTTLGMSLIDNFTHYALAFLDARSDYRVSLEELFRSFRFDRLHSNVQYRSWLARPLSDVPVSDFFSALLETEPTNATADVGLRLSGAGASDADASDAAAASEALSSDVFDADSAEDWLLPL